MRAFSLTLLLLFSLNSVAAQKLPQWYRVYTFDESFIDMNTGEVVLGGDIGRITFRWTFDQPQVLTGDPSLKYKSRLETMEFRCSDHLFRMYELAFLNLSGKIVRSQLMRPPYTWHKYYDDSATGRLAGPACELIHAKLDPDATKRSANEQNQLDKAAKFARSIKQTLEQSRDFKTLIEKFFATDFIRRYLDDDETNWFYNLNRETAAKASNAELKRFYVAMLNAGYLTSLYVISQSPSDEDPETEDSLPKGRMLPVDVKQLVDSHPYTITYESNQGGYDYLAEGY